MEVIYINTSAMWDEIIKGEDTERPKIFGWGCLLIWLTGTVLPVELIYYLDVLICFLADKFFYEYPLT